MEDYKFKDKYIKILVRSRPIGKEKIVLYWTTFDLEAYERDIKLKEQEEYYSVKIGDTLWDIANKYRTTWQHLAEINRIKNPDLIYPTQRIRIK